MIEVRWHVGDVIRKLREGRGWNQNALGKKAGMNKATVVAIESKPEARKTETVAKAAEALGVRDLGELYTLVPTSRVGATADVILTDDERLQFLIDHWPDLEETTRAQIAEFAAIDVRTRVGSSRTAGAARATPAATGRTAPPRPARHPEPRRARR